MPRCLPHLPSPPELDPRLLTLSDEDRALVAAVRLWLAAVIDMPVQTDAFGRWMIIAGRSWSEVYITGFRAVVAIWLDYDTIETAIEQLTEWADYHDMRRY